MIPRRLARLLARSKPLVPDALWPLAHTLRSVPGRGPLVGLPAFRRVVALAAHPDDESLGCAGTLALLADSGARLTVVFATDGEGTRGSALDPAETGRLRTAEAREACGLLGVTDVRLLGRPDGALATQTAELAVELSAVFTELQPDLVLLPWFLDGHPDHEALSVALARSSGLPPQAEVWGYETWTPLPANRIVDISSTFARKRAALAAHRTAHLAFDVSAGAALSRWRSIHGLMGVGEAEAFLAAGLSDYCALASRADAVRPGA